jgi:hypothetical protein
VITSAPFTAFESLKKDCGDLFEAFQAHSRQFNNAKWWLLLEQLENIDSRLKTLNNINKWSRSSLTKVAYDPSVIVQYSMKQNQNLEKIASDVLKSSNTEEWADIAIDNYLTEEDYSSEGGVSLNLKLSKANRGLQINSVVAVIQGKSVYGKDLSQKLQFDGDQNDLRVLGYDDTILQSIKILSLLKKNDNPDFPNEGLQSAVVVGSNRGTLNFPIIVRQMAEVFKTDDTLKNFNITSLSVQDDNLAIDYKVQTRLNETYEDQTII